MFDDPSLGASTSAVADKIHNLPHGVALEFHQTYNLRVISVVLAVPPLTSAIFACAWIVIFVRRGEANRERPDVQVIVATAFTVASYIITTGM